MMIEIYNKEYITNKDKYNFIIEEKQIEGWGIKHSVGRAKPKFYRILKNNKSILDTTVWQTWKKYIRNIKG